jgi:hypothetical protein
MKEAIAGQTPTKRSKEKLPKNETAIAVSKEGINRLDVYAQDAKKWCDKIGEECRQYYNGHVFNSCFSEEVNESLAKMHGTQLLYSRMAKELSEGKPVKIVPKTEVGFSSRAVDINLYHYYPDEKGTIMEGYEKNLGENELERLIETMFPGQSIYGGKDRQKIIEALYSKKTVVLSFHKEPKPRSGLSQPTV